ncbi:DUF1674 domain-containing protein [Parvularcula sp. LCG005]|uniref:DUF1674 domain-containing protein n=1 Tax=Parvularcula sp. LCG005 TaxID=3078805 RepID=UPI0029420C7E|nr:DUF1674 domain-containing protein [Parvularcula sp. LCG005]WOI53320.1 DUF1674 domain-containing protein [Parvularcula sp. LCG005]
MTEKGMAEDVDVVPVTEDGIPTVVNGQELTDLQIQALREARIRRDNEAAGTRPAEVGGADRTTDPTRYGDWEKAGRAIDFS